MILDMYIEPKSGEFEIGPIDAFVESLPLCVRDAKKPSTFMLASDQDTLDDAVTARERDATSFPASVMLIDVHPKRIDLAYRIEALDAGRTFVAWMRDHYPIIVRDEDYNDVTAQLDPDLEVLFGART
jgi:hypothetical protein